MSDEKPVFLGSAPRSEAVPLAFPLSFSGKDYHEIIVRRITAGEVAAFFEVLSPLPEAERGKRSLPVFYHPDGEAVPDAVLASLDADDDLRVWEVANRFLPLRFRGRGAASDSTPTTGDPTEP